MLLQRVWLPQLNNHLRQYAKKSRAQFKPIMAVNKRMVHQEILHYVNPFARINVKSDIFLRIQPADVHLYTSGTVQPQLQLHQLHQPQLQLHQQRPQTLAPTVTPAPYRFYTAAPQLQHLQQLYYLEND